MNGSLRELACVWDSRFWNKKQSLWYSFEPFIDLGLCEHSIYKFVLLHLHLIKYGWLPLPALAKWHAALFSKTTPASLFHHHPLSSSHLVISILQEQQQSGERQRHQNSNIGT